MFVNKLCQICETEPRKKATLYDGSIWLLCEECSSKPSKFSEGKDVTEHHPLDSVYIRDIMKNQGPHSGFYEKAFVFRCLSDSKIYMNVPRLYRGYKDLQVLDMKSRDIVWFQYDIKIQLLEWNSLL